MSTAVTTQVTELAKLHQRRLASFRRHRISSTSPIPPPPNSLRRTPLSTTADVDAAVQAAAAAFPAWRRTPPGERVQYLFKLKNLLEEHIDELSRLITLENGKTFAEAKAELRRGIENVEVACGIPMMMQGYNLEDVTPGVDEMQIRQPLGVVAAITPFNFPAMIAYWFLPYAIACGNTFILKPSERVPLTMLPRHSNCWKKPASPKASSISSTAAAKSSTRSAIIRKSARSALSAPLLSPSMSTRAPRPAASACNARAAQKITSSFFPTPTWNWPRKSSATAPSAAPASAASPCRVAVTIGEAQKTFRDSIAHAASTSESATASTLASRWAR